MKRFFSILLTLAVCLAATPCVLTAQQKVSTKKYKIADLTTRTTKVVLSGNDLTDTSLKEEVAKCWRISPYEFCTVAEYNALKKSSDHYFLLLASSQEKKYQGILTITLLKGGDPDSDDQRKRPVDVASLPFCPAGFPSGREMTMMGAMLDIIQDFAYKAMESDKDGYTGFDIYSRNLKHCARKRICFASGDLVPEMDPAIIRRCFDDDMVIRDDAAADAEFTARPYNTLVSYCVSPSDPVKGSLCYKMLIDADSHELLYYAHHRISDRDWAGFLPKDIRKIASVRKLPKK